VKEAFSRFISWDPIMYVFPIMFSILAYFSLLNLLSNLISGIWILHSIAIGLSLPLGFLITLLVVMLKIRLSGGK